MKTSGRLVDWGLSPSPTMGNAAFGQDTVTPSGYTQSISKVRLCVPKWGKAGAGNRSSTGLSKTGFSVNKPYCEKDTWQSH